MKMLSNEGFRRARTFLYTYARLLERALFSWWFEGGHNQAVIDALAGYQNADGGFGCALEPDFRLGLSSPLATSVAFQVIRQLDLPGDHPLVRRGMEYLIRTYDPRFGGWHPVPPEVNQAPHAPWWHYDEVAGKCTVETPANPTAEIVGYLHAYADLIPQANLLGDVTSNALQALAQTPNPIRMHDGLCFLRLVRELPPPQRALVLSRLRQSLPLVVSRQPEEWSGYAAQPLLFVDSPESPLADLLLSEVQQNLDYKVDTQSADGCWSPNWTWSGSFPAAWPEAEIEWKGVLTLRTLRELAAFDRIEGWAGQPPTPAGS